jgi:Bacterial PH domain
VKTWRSWPWTIALAAVLAGFALLGVIGLGLRTSPGEIAISLVITGAAVVGLLRVLSMGVRATPSGMIIRDLTRTRRVLWDQVRRVTCEPTDRRGVYVPVLHLSGQRAGAARNSAARNSTARGSAARGSAAQNSAARGGAGGGSGGGRRGNGVGEDVEITVLGSYQQAVAQRRATEIEATRLASTKRRP